MKGMVMQLWLVRHAVAVDREEFTGPDAERPLTDKGRRRFRDFCDWLADQTEAGLREILVAELVRVPANVPQPPRNSHEFRYASALPINITGQAVIFRCRQSRSPYRCRRTTRAGASARIRD